MKRVMLIGCAGTGKSTLAPKLAAKLKVPVIHLDQHFWKPGWVEPEREEFNSTLLKLLKKKAWVMDGHYGSYLDFRLKHADTVIMLDFSRWVSLRRVLWRIVKTYGRTRADMAPGCREQFDWGFLAWIWNFHKRSRVTTLERLVKLKKSTKIIILRKPSEVQALLDSI